MVRNLAGGGGQNRRRTNNLSNMQQRTCKMVWYFSSCSLSCFFVSLNLSPLIWRKCFLGKILNACEDYWKAKTISHFSCWFPSSFSLTKSSVPRFCGSISGGLGKRARTGNRQKFQRQLEPLWKAISCVLPGCGDIQLLLLGQEKSSNSKESCEGFQRLIRTTEPFIYKMKGLSENLRYQNCKRFQIQPAIDLKSQ